MSAELDATHVDPLRAGIEVLDCRGKPLAEVAESIRTLPARPREREPLSLSGPAILERKPFLSRKTSFPIFSSDVGDSWLQLLNLALRIGTEKQDADAQKRFYRPRRP